MIRKILLLTGAMALMAACGGGDEDGIRFEKVQADKITVLSNDDNSPSCRVHLEVDYATDDNGHRAEIVNNTIERRLLDMQDLKMKQAVDSFADLYTTNYKKNFLPLYNQDRADTSKRSWYEYHYIITTDVTKGYKGLSVYHVNLDYYEGGAHGINQHLTMNFDKETGQQLALQGIFVPGYEGRLNAILLEALQEKTGSKSLAELHDKGYLYSMDMFPSENFILADDTITFIYNPYEIAPYAAGTTELVIPYSQLEDILKNSFF